MKHYLPDEEYFWEATWYERGGREFAAVEVGGAKVGFLICTDMWFTEHARAYAREGVHLLAVPRATAFTSLEQWLAGGRAAAVVSGAWCLSSNRGGTDGEGTLWTGGGWIIEPESGQVLCVTSDEEPFRTLEIDLPADRARQDNLPALRARVSLASGPPLSPRTPVYSYSHWRMRTGAGRRRPGAASGGR
ncbi:MAG: carbon-nitrogen hydrolase family protein [Thermoanaerobaculia bacterium]